MRQVLPRRRLWCVALWGQQTGVMPLCSQEHQPPHVVEEISWAACSCQSASLLLERRRHHALPPSANRHYSTWEQLESEQQRVSMMATARVELPAAAQCWAACPKAWSDPCFVCVLCALFVRSFAIPATLWMMTFVSPTAMMMNRVARYENTCVPAHCKGVLDNHNANVGMQAQPGQAGRLISRPHAGRNYAGLYEQLSRGQAGDAVGTPLQTFFIPLALTR